MENILELLNELPKSKSSYKQVQNTLLDVYEADNETPAIERLNQIIVYLLNHRSVKKLYGNKRNLLDSELAYVIECMDEESMIDKVRENPEYSEIVPTAISTVFKNKDISTLFIGAVVRFPIILVSTLASANYNLNAGYVGKEELENIEKVTHSLITSLLVSGNKNRSQLENPEVQNAFAFILDNLASLNEQIKNAKGENND